MSPKLARNIEAGVVCVGVVALLIWVPERWFLELAMALLVAGIGGTLGARKYIERLVERANALDAAGESGEATVLRVRRRMVIDLGMAFAIVGLTAFIALLVVYGD